MTNKSSRKKISGGEWIAIAFGVVIIIGSIALLSWSESETIRTYRNLSEGADRVISVAADTVDTSNEGALVHVSDWLTTDETVSDPEFGVVFQGPLLVRIVEMHQWHESSSTKDGKTTYKYHKDWSQTLIDSTDFHSYTEHQNPTHMPYQSQSFPVQNAWAGAFQIPAELILAIEDRHAMAVKAETLPESLKQDFIVYRDNYLHSKTPAEPEIGDIRIRYQNLPQTALSVVARQVDNRLLPYRTSSGDELLLLKTSPSSAAEMFGSEHSDNRLWSWGFRLLSFVIMLLGLILITTTLPYRFNIANTALLAVAGFAIVSAVNWFFYQWFPALGFVLLALAALSFFAYRLRQIKTSPANGQ